jgi:hypothetical protein
MRNMYYDYAHKKAEIVAELRQELFEVNIWMTCGYLCLLCCIFVEEHLMSSSTVQSIHMPS